MTPEELVNLSLSYEVEIEPFTMIPAIQLLTFNFKGCTPLKSSRMPLFLALHLKSLNVCAIKLPKYLSEEYIDILIEKEKADSAFCDIPEYFFEHSFLFMSNEIESRVNILKSLRRTKIWKGLATLDGKALYVNGLSRWEFNEFDQLIKQTMEKGREIQAETE